MNSDALLHASHAAPPRPLCALVLMGGGARTAYQAGVLRALGAMLALGPQPSAPFPFQLLVGTSAGALNAAYLACRARLGLGAFEQLASFWRQIRSSDVYALHVSTWERSSRWITALRLSLAARAHGAALDSMPLVDTLHRAIPLADLELALQERAINALAVTASSYTSGVHWTFCHRARDEPLTGWRLPGRRAEFQPITIEHLMASSALPFLFPATPLWVDGAREFFGDGSMRQTAPLSPALHLGARKVLAIGVGQPQRSGLAGGPAGTRPPSLGSIAGHAMASVFHDTLQADVEQALRVNQALRQLPPEVAARLPYRGVEVLSIQPSESLDAVAQAHAQELPRDTRNALRGLGALRGGGAALASYLLFEPGFVEALMALGERDAYARRHELLAFLDGEN